MTKEAQPQKETLRIGFAQALAIAEQVIASRDEADLKTIQSVLDEADKKGDLKVAVPCALLDKYTPR